MEQKRQKTEQKAKTDPKYLDCYYFLYKTCDNKECRYRHCEAAKDSNELCEDFNRTKECPNNDTCTKRHSSFHIKRNRNEEFCRWEKTENGCTNENCEFQHTKPNKGRKPTEKSRREKIIQKLEEVLQMLKENDINLDDNK